jgi:hypothetical protein
VKAAFISAGSAPTAGFSASTVSGPAPLQVDFSDLSAGAPTGWLWDFGDGGSAASQDPSHSFTTPGTYTVTLTASNACGSDPEVKIGYISVLTPVGVPTGAPGAGRLVLQALRNPRRGGASLRVEVPGAEPATLRFVDAGGRMVRELVVAGGPGARQVEWDGRDDGGQRVGAGLYLVLARAGEATAGTKVVLLR